MTLGNMIPGYGPLSDRPDASHMPGGLYNATDIGVVYTSDGSTWDAMVSGGTSSGIQGRFQLDALHTTFTIYHDEIDESSEFPVCSMEVSGAASDLYIVGIHNRTSTSFKVTLSDFPTSSDYILWHISTQSVTVVPGTTDNQIITALIFG